MQADRPVARVLIADDHDLVREGLRGRLESEPDLKVVGEAADGREALDLCRRLLPDLVLMDVRMPEMDGLEATRAIKEELPRISVVMVTMHEDPDYLFEAVRAGAAGYILKGASKESLLTAVRQVLSGESPLDQALAMQLLRRLTRQPDSSSAPARSSKKAPEPPVEPLTDRELDVLQCVAQGQTNPQIARTLLISMGTVKTHIQHIIAKLGVSDRTQAAVRASELGLLTDDS